MVGIPNQTNEDLVNDLLFVKEFEPAMCGIGPFIPHKDTPLKDYEHGSLEKTIICLAIVRLLLPKVLLPATTALSSISENGREEGLKAGGINTRAGIDVPFVLWLIAGLIPLFFFQV